MNYIYIVLLCITVVLLILKTIHFVRHFRRKPLHHFIYFGHVAKVISTDSNRIRKKNLQNELTVFILLCALLTFVFFFLYGRS